MGNEKTTEVWQYRKVYYDINGEPAAYAKIPDTHRVVSRDFLIVIDRLLDSGRYSLNDHNKLRDIIDNKGEA